MPVFLFYGLNVLCVAFSLRPFNAEKADGTYITGAFQFDELPDLDSDRSSK